MVESPPCSFNTTMQMSLFARLVRSNVSGYLAILFLMLGVGLTGLRIYRQYSSPGEPFDFSRSGLSDFHNGAYYPSLAFREGVSPYSSEACEKYPLARSTPPYSPVVFMLYTPLTYLSLEQADVAFFILNVLMIGLIGLLSLTMSGAKWEWAPWVWVVGLLVFSRPGHITLFTGYFTAQLVIGTLVAVHFAKTRPFLSGLGMMLASGKPTYILPLTILMLCRKNFKAVAIGMVFCAAGAAMGLGWLASHSSVRQVIDGVKQGQAAHDHDPTEDPVNTWTRLDTVGMVSKVMAWKPDNKTYLAAMLLLLVLPGIAVWRCASRESNGGATGLTGMIVCLAMLVAIYHHSYDCLLMAVAWVGVTFYGKSVCPEMRKTEHRLLAVLLAIPALNYLSTLRFRDLLGVDNQSMFWHLITSINGVCLLVALIMLIAAALRTSRATENEFAVLHKEH